MVQELEQAIVVAQDAVAKQGDTVRSLKASLKDGKIEKVRQADNTVPVVHCPHMYHNAAWHTRSRVDAALVLCCKLCGLSVRRR